MTPHGHHDLIPLIALSLMGPCALLALDWLVEGLGLGRLFDREEDD